MAKFENEGCQCPGAGACHFYSLVGASIVYEKEDVSMPWSGRMPFLHIVNSVVL